MFGRKALNRAKTSEDYLNEALAAEHGDDVVNNAADAIAMMEGDSPVQNKEESCDDDLGDRDAENNFLLECESDGEEEKGGEEKEEREEKGGEEEEEEEKEKAEDVAVVEATVQIEEQVEEEKEAAEQVEEEQVEEEQVEEEKEEEEEKEGEDAEMEDVAAVEATVQIEEQVEEQEEKEQQQEEDEEELKDLRISDDEEENNEKDDNDDEPQEDDDDGEDLSDAGSRRGADLTLDEINAISDDEERMILKAEYYEAHSDEEMPAEPEVSQEDAVKKTRRKQKPSEILRQERTIVFEERQVEEKSFDDLVTTINKRILERKKELEIKKKKQELEKKQNQAGKQPRGVMLTLSDPEDSDDEDEGIILPNIVFKKSDKPPRKVPPRPSVPLPPANKKQYTNRMNVAANAANALRDAAVPKPPPPPIIVAAPVPAAPAPKVSKLLVNKDKLNTEMEATVPFADLDVDTNNDHTESSFHLALEETQTMEIEHDDDDDDDNEDDGPGPGLPAEDGDKEDNDDDKQDDDDNDDDKQEDEVAKELKLREIGAVGNSVRDGFNLRVGSNADYLREELEEVDPGDSEPDDFIDLELTDDEDDDDGNDVANSEDEEFIEKKNIEANLQKLYEARGRLEAEEEYDLEGKILDVVRGKARERAVRKIAEEDDDDRLPGQYRRKRKGRDDDDDGPILFDSFARNLNDGEDGVVDVEMQKKLHAEMVKRAQYRREKKKFLNELKQKGLLGVQDYSNSSDNPVIHKVFRAGTPEPRTVAPNPQQASSATVIGISTLTRQLSTSSSAATATSGSLTNSQEYFNLRRASSNSLFGNVGAAALFSAADAQSGHNSNSKAFFFQKVKENTATAAASDDNNTTMTTSAAKLRRVASATDRPAVFAKKQPKSSTGPLRKSDEKNSKKYNSVLNCL